MSSVTFPVAIGGDGSTVTDDDNPTTGLRNGGWRTRFIPCFTNLVDIADYVVSYTAQTTTFASPPPMGSTAPNTGAFTNLNITGSTAPENGLSLPAANTLALSTNSTVRLRIGSTGNTSLGSTAPSWDSTSIGFDVNKKVLIASTPYHQSVSFNTYYGSIGWAASTTGVSAFLGMSNSGELEFWTAASATANSLINPNLQFTINNSGEMWQALNATQTAAYLRWGQSGNQPYASIGAYYDSSSAGHLEFYTMAGSSSYERMRLDSAGNLQIEGGLLMPGQVAQTSKSAAATLTGAELITGVLQYTGAAATVNLPAGSAIESALTWSASNVSLDWYVVNTGTGACTIGANANTTVGSLTVTNGTSAHFRIRRTASNTFTVYRLG